MQRHLAHPSSWANRVDVVIESSAHQRYPIELGHQPQMMVQVTRKKTPNVGALEFKR